MQKNHLIVSGLNYHSTPLAIRERFTIPESCLTHALKALKALPHVEESAVLSTCNRTEVYAVVSDVQAGLKEIELFFNSTQKILDHHLLAPNFKLLRDDAALHLFRVAAGLDSLVLGEGQIMSQVKTAHQAALQAGTAGPTLDQIFKLALGCGKRVRSETSMGRRAVSISSAAVELARTHLGSLRHKTVMLVGAGKMAQLCVKHLLGEIGNGSIIILNRTKDRIEKLLENKLPNREQLRTAFDYQDRYQLATGVDLIIVATSAPSFVLTKEGLESQNFSRKLTIIDISVPRNVDCQVGELSDVQLYNCDHLAKLISANLKERESLVGEAENIVLETLDSYYSWQRSLLVVPTIAELRQKIESIRLAQMEKNQTICAKPDQQDASETIEAISRAIVNQILHHPTVQLKATRDYQILRQQAEALRTLFNLDPLDTGSCAANTRSKATEADYLFSLQQIDASLEAQQDEEKEEQSSHLFLHASS